MFHRSSARCCTQAALLVAGSLPACDAAESTALERETLRLVERRCASSDCHGVESGAVPTGVDTSAWLTFEVLRDGRIAEPADALAALRRKVNSGEDPAFSTLLRKTLPLSQGGLPHDRGPIFASRGDPAYRRLEAFAIATEGTEGDDEPPLNDLERQFGETVHPILTLRGCSTATCHGPRNFGTGAFHPPPLPGRTDVPRAELRAAYREARRNLTLWGAPRRARLLAKITPLEAGGIPHKGGNDVFLAATTERGAAVESAPEVSAILAWQDAERRAALGAAAERAGVARAIIFVGGPLAPAGPFERPPFTPGTDLYRLDPPFGASPPVNLTAGLHDGPVDIRDPAVSHDGKQLVFTLRRSADDAPNLYLMGIDGRGVRALTQDTAWQGGGRREPMHHASPVFGPAGGHRGGEPRIYFSSTLADEPSDDALLPNADLYAVRLDGSGLERLTFTNVPEIEPTFLSVGEFAGTMAYTIRRAVTGGEKGVVFRFPIDHDAKQHLQPEAHPHFGMSEPPAVFYRLRELPDGRSVVTLLDAGNVWRAGPVGLLERQFGVDLPPSTSARATLPGFRHALTTLIPGVPRAGLAPAGAFRDPTPLPDGRVLVARTEGALNLDRPVAPPPFALAVLTLGVDRGTQRPTLDAVETLFADPSVSVSQPVAVYVRPPEDENHDRAYVEDASVPATLLHSGVPVIDALLGRLTPDGPRAVPDDLVALRALSPLSALGPVDQTRVPVAELRHEHPAATRASLTGHMPLFQAAEWPIAPDGSVAALLTPRMPLRFVAIAADGLATRNPHHHWYAMKPGERFPVGIPEGAFPARCAGCHGAMDGLPGSVFRPEVDVVTGASVTEARFEYGDRRRPRDLPGMPADARVFVDFVTDVVPVLNTACISCHGAETPAGGLSLTDRPTLHYVDAYESLLGPGEGSAGGFRYVDARGHSARASYLVEKLLGRELDAPRAVSSPCPPAGATALAETQVEMIVRWVELGAAFRGRPETVR